MLNYDVARTHGFDKATCYLIYNPSIFISIGCGRGFLFTPSRIKLNVTTGKVDE